MVKTLGQLIAIVIITMGGLFIASTLLPQNTSRAIPGNECSYVPEKYKHFDFSNACQNHDDCYAERTLSRYRCDKNFYYEMKDTCRTLNDGYWRCRSAAKTYYYGVRIFGSPMYNQDSSSKIYRWHQYYVKYLERT